LTPMWSIAMDLCATHTHIPVTVLWVVRTVEELNVFAYEMCQAQRRFPQLTVKVWITLSANLGPSNITLEDGTNYLELNKAEIKDLVPEEQCNRVLERLQELNKNMFSLGKKKGSSISSHMASEQLYVIENGGMGPVINASVMTLATIICLCGYAFSQRLNNMYDIGPQDKLAFLDLVLVVALLIAFLAVVEGVRRAVWNCRKKNRPMHSKLSLPPPPTPTNGSSTSLSNHMRELDDFAEPADEEIVFDMEDIPSVIGHKGADMMDMVHDMIIGRIGGRPNIPAEFMQAAANCSPLKKNPKSDAIYNIDVEEGLPVDIGVLACGPIPLIESIDNFCNKSSLFSWGLSEGEGSKTFFTFEEEDWEW